jgi:hypothetical protein
MNVIRIINLNYIIDDNFGLIESDDKEEDDSIVKRNGCLRPL